MTAPSQHYNTNLSGFSIDIPDILIYSDILIFWTLFSLAGNRSLGFRWSFYVYLFSALVWSSANEDINSESISLLTPTDSCSSDWPIFRQFGQEIENTFCLNHCHKFEWERFRRCCHFWSPEGNTKVFNKYKNTTRWQLMGLMISLPARSQDSRWTL